MTRLALIPSIHFLRHIMLLVGMVVSSLLSAADPGANNAGAHPVNPCCTPTCTINGPTELMKGEADQLLCHLNVANIQGIFSWSVVEGPLQIAAGGDGAEEEDCPQWGTEVEDGCIEQSLVKVRGTEVGKGKIKVKWTNGFCDSGTSKYCDTECEIEITIIDRLKPPPKVAVGSKFIRVDIHGVPMPDPSPTGEGEQDRIPNQAYTDMYSLSPQYNVTDIAVPVEGGELALEFRRTMSIKSHNYNYDLAKRSITYPTDWVLGLGWDTNIASRIIVSLEKDESETLRTTARVIDEVGSTLEYMTNAMNNGPFVPDITHSFSNQALKATLTRAGGTVPTTDGGRPASRNLIVTKTHGTVLTYSYVRTFVPVQKFPNGCDPTFQVLHMEDYYRLDSVADRNGNTIVFTYPYINNVAFNDMLNNQPPEAGGPNQDLLPGSIHEAAHPERRITFTYANIGYEGPGFDPGWRLATAKDPLGRVITYQHFPREIPPVPFDPNSSIDPNARRLQSVTKPAVAFVESDGDSVTAGTAAPSVHFTYTRAILFDLSIDPFSPQTELTGKNHFVGPATITDARGHQTSFGYALEWFPSAVYAYVGAPVWQQRMRVATETTIDGTAVFDTVERTPLRVVTQVTDVMRTPEVPSGTTTTFEFTSIMVPYPNLAGQAVAITNLRRTSQLSSGPKVVSFDYSPDVNCNLTQVRDISGNVITYDYTGDGSYNFKLWNKPASRTVVNPNGPSLTTTYRYQAGFNKLRQTTDAAGQTTIELMDAKGNRTHIQEPLGKTTVFEYETDGFIKKVTDPEGRVTRIAREFAPTIPGSGPPANTPPTSSAPLAFLTTTTTVDGKAGDNMGITSVAISDLMGNQRKMRDPRGFETTIDVDALNRPVLVTKPAVENPAAPGSTITSSSATAYDLNGNTTRVIDDEGKVSITGYDAMNRQIVSRRRMTNNNANDDANDLITRTRYHQVGLPRESIDAKGNITSMAYDGLLRLVRTEAPLVTLPDGSTTRYVTRNFYGTLNDGVTADAGTNPGSGAFTHWSGWQPTRVLTTRSRVGTSGAQETFLIATDTVYDFIYRPIRSVQRRDDGATVASTAPARAASGDHPAEPWSETVYNNVHKPVRTIVRNHGEVPDQHTFTYYDSLHRPTVTVVDMNDGNAYLAPGTIIDDAGTYPNNGGDADLITRMRYDLSDLTVAATDPLNRTTDTEYDGAKRPVRVLQPLVTVYDPSGYNPNGAKRPESLTAYDLSGNKTLVTNANGIRTRMEYDARNRPIRSIVDLDGSGTFTATFNGPDIVSTTLFNLVDKPLIVTDSRGNATDTAYDNAWRTVTVTQPLVANAELPGTSVRPVIRTYYDKNSNVVRMEDARGVATTNVYDELNRMRTATQAAGTPAQVVSETQYDAANNVLALILRNTAGNGGDQVTRYTVDVYNRKLNETLPAVADGLVRQSSFTYRPNGTVHTSRDAKGQVHEMAYDRANRLTQSLHKRADTTVEETRTFTYSKTGKALTVSDVTGTSTHTYDGLDRPLSETRTPAAALAQAAYTVFSDFDAVGNRTRVRYPGTNRTLESHYDRAGRLTQVRDGAKVTAYVYDVNGNRLRVTTPNGVATDTTFDALNRATIVISATGGSLTARYDYLFDLVGNRRRVVETLPPQAPRTVDYTYDAQYRLTGESTAGFSQAIQYDPAGNRTQLTRVEGATTTVITYQCDRLNRLLSSSASVNGAAAQVTSYGYDLNGNQISQAIPGYPAIAMQWDSHDRLVGGNALGVTAGAAAKYDYRTRRQSKAAGTDVTFFRYDQGDAFQEFKAAAMQVEFIRGSGMGGGIGSILYSDRTAAGGSEETFTYNGAVGHVVALTNGIGATTETNRFDAFGNVIGTTGFSLNNRIANTKERDVSIPGVFTLDNHGFRYYNPVTGRYLNRDPLGYADGMNPYLYVHNNPINSIDPLGLWDWGWKALRVIGNISSGIADTVTFGAVGAVQDKMGVSGSVDRDGIAYRGAATAANLNPAGLVKGVVKEVVKTVVNEVKGEVQAAVINAASEATGTDLSLLADAADLRRRGSKGADKAEGDNVGVAKGVQPEGGTKLHTDPEPANYPGTNVSRSQPVDDHIQARALGGADADHNINKEAHEANSIKGGHEGEHARELQELIDQGMAPDRAKEVMQENLEWLKNDAGSRARRAPEQYLDQFEANE